MPSPLVTVVIPIYNQAKFVVETVGSVVRQTHRNLQVVVVDDGSTDDGADLLAAEFGDQIVLLRQENAGPSAAINAGIAAADGEFIALLGGDDVCVEDRIDVQLDIMRTTAHDIVFSKPLLIDEAGQPLADEAFPVFFNTVPEASMLRALLLRGNFLCAPSAFMRREAVQQVGRFRPGLIQLQDYDYWLRAAAAGLSLAETGPRVVKYRRHSANLSSPRANFASTAESIPIVRSVLDTGRPGEFRRAFPHFFEPAFDPAAPLTLFNKAMFLLSHPRDEMRMIGVEYLVALAEDPAFLAKADRFGFKLPQFIRNAV
jgi:GT2 family glycosyltransferase